MLQKEEIEKILKKIPDPELGISLWDLGLIYEIKIEDRHVKIMMTLTTMGCPLFSVMEKEIKKKVGKLKEVDRVEIELTFDPPWNTDRMSNEAKEELGL
jgi:metal-sulfur cluster biosynthetic enzyme